MIPNPFIADLHLKSCSSARSDISGSPPFAGRNLHRSSQLGYGRAVDLALWEIASPAAAGLIDKQIGQKLFLSPRTVSTHLYQVFPKPASTARAALRDALEQLNRE